MNEQADYWEKSCKAAWDEIDDYQQRQDEIIVALGSKGLSPSEIVPEIERLLAEDSLKTNLLSQLYQIVGSMADDIGVFEYDNVQALLTEIVEPTGKQFLPWDSFSDKAPASTGRTQNLGRSTQDLGSAEQGRDDE